MTELEVRDRLARISARPPGEWQARLAREFPTDPVLRSQALLWLHADHDGLELDGVPPSLGEAADERYELAVRLAAGARASVWQAHDRRLGRNVAIKVFHERGESEAIAQVIAEARAASDVVSEHVVRVLDVQYGDGHPYIVMGLVSEYDADSGDVVLGTTASAARPRDPAEVARWVMQVARGVHEAHLRNVFHRDLKPSNVLITPLSRRARVADFGLAVSESTPDVAHPTITLLRGGPSGPVSVRGTPEYMAPEQARGLPLALDPRTAADRAVLVGIDVWGLGAIAYELLSGRPPWLARKADDLSAWEVAASSERPPPLERTRDGDRIPRRLRRVVDKAMAIDPAARYPSAAAFARELEAVLDRRPTSLDQSRAMRLALWSRRNPQLALTVLVAIGLTAVALVSRAALADLRAERDALDRRLAAQKGEAATLAAEVATARTELAETRGKLATERDNLAAVEQSVADERTSYQTLIDAKEQSLADANATTRRIMDQLTAAQRERRAAERASARLQRLIEDVRREGDSAARDRDRIRREREAARAERDAAIAERDRIEGELSKLKVELDRLGRGKAKSIHE